MRLKMIPQNDLNQIKRLLHVLTEDERDKVLIELQHQLLPLSQSNLNNLLCECLFHKNTAMNYTCNVMWLLAQCEKVNFLSIDVSPFKALIQKQTAAITDACLQFIDAHRQFFPTSFLESLTIEIEWLAKYRDTLVSEMKNEGKL